MKRRKIALGLSTALAAFAFASCTNNENTRNTTTPYGNLNLSSNYATALDGQYSLSTEMYYNRLRNKSYELFVNEVKSNVYSKQIQAVKKLLTSSSYSDMGSDMDALALVNYEGKQPTAQENEARYEYLKKNVKKNISKTIISSAVGTTVLKTYRAKTEKELNTSITKYIEQKNLAGYSIKKEDLVIIEDEDTNYISLDLTKLPQDILDEQILAQAEAIYDEIKLYSIADAEYLPVDTDDDGIDDDEEKNSNYLFDDDDTSNIKAIYESYEKTYGTYNAVTVQFNTRREAVEAVNHVMNALGLDEINDSNAEQFYLALYNYSYNYRGANFSSVNDNEFIFEVNEDYNGLSELSSSANSIITNTLKDGEYLVEPRNVSNKYLMAYRIKTTYAIGNKEEAIEFDDLKDELSEDQYNALIYKLKNRIIVNSSSNYKATALSKAIDELDIKIYDPFLEYKFYYTYSDEYELINKNDFKNTAVYSIGGVDCSVESFFQLASKKYGYSIVNDYFQWEYVYQFANDFLDDDTISGYETTLDSAIDTFNKNENSTYPSEIGLETFLLSSYGFTTKDDVLKYYYTASKTLSAYISKTVFDEFSTSEHTLSEYALKDNGILNSILKKGNEEYSKLFGINLDHILINIDDDGDGSPDNPTIFMAKLTAEQKEKFTNAVVELARAIYEEATYEAYSDNSIFENLSYICSEFNKGSQLKSNPAKTWDDYKEFRFLLKAEQLASSGNITQDSVSNFVTPFADYVKELYKIADKNDVSVDSEKGIFFATADSEATFEGGEITESSQITYNNICETSFGFHVLVLNSYERPNSLKYTSSDDTYSYQSAIEVLLNEGDDEDSDDDNIYVKLNSYNENRDSANLNQLFIYYIQKKNGDTSSLDSSITTVLSSLFDDVISTYESSNFQTLILLDKLNIQVTSDTTLTDTLSTYRSYLVNNITEYGDEAKYADWCVKGTTEYDFSRPTK